MNNDQQRNNQKSYDNQSPDESRDRATEFATHSVMQDLSEIIGEALRDGDISWLCDAIADAMQYKTGSGSVAGSVAECGAWQFVGKQCHRHLQKAIDAAINDEAAKILAAQGNRHE